MRRVALLLALAACSASFASASDEEVHQSLVRLREVGGWKPTGIIDIGAHEADWSRGAQKVFPDAKYLLLEGDSDLEPRLKAFGKPYEIAIVGARDGKVTCAPSLPTARLRVTGRSADCPLFSPRFVAIRFRRYISSHSPRFGRRSLPRPRAPALPAKTKEALTPISCNCRFPIPPPSLLATTGHQHEKWKTGNSIYLENTNIFHDEGGSVRKVERNMRTLDTIIAERGENVKYNLLKVCSQTAGGDSRTAFRAPRPEECIRRTLASLTQAVCDPLLSPSRVRSATCKVPSST